MWAPYLIIGFMVAFFLIMLLVVIVRNKEVGQWAYVSLGGYATIMSLVLFVWFLLHTGLISKWSIDLGDGKTFVVSPYKFEEIVTANIDNLGIAIAQAYEEFYIIETFDLSKESEKFRFVQNRGKVDVVLALKNKPIEKTIIIIPSYGIMNFEPDRPIDNVDENNMLSVGFLEHETIDGAKILCKSNNIHLKVSYVRKLESTDIKDKG